MSQKIEYKQFKREALKISYYYQFYKRLKKIVKDYDAPFGEGQSERWSLYISLFKFK